MSEYWKSTPKYWCKHCKTFVKDTKLEKTNHDATPKHQGNIKRFLRDLHRGHEREERDKQRAKDEVQRLNGVVSGSVASDPAAAAGAPWRRKPIVPSSVGTLNQTATPAQRKQQLAQLAEMGVTVPEDFRKELAMAGEWQVLSETPIRESETIKAEMDDRKPNMMNVGVRKRKYEGQDGEDEAEERVFRSGWGLTTRVYPGLNEKGEGDLDLLLGKSQTNTRRSKVGVNKTAGESSPQDQKFVEQRVASETDQSTLERPSIKREDSGETGTFLSLAPSLALIDHNNIKAENTPLEPEVTFKKRKAKPIRQK
ncbi:hypothetical protein MMC07_000270 [Pseudocyphellaria aurata]|nr:hypothetical protein [Pseudocyphellaria aurata]